MGWEVRRLILARRKGVTHFSLYERELSKLEAGDEARSNPCSSCSGEREVGGMWQCERWSILATGPGEVPSFEADERWCVDCAGWTYEKLGG